MKALLDIIIMRHECVGKACPSDVTFKVMDYKHDNPLQEIHLKGMENIDYLIPLGIYGGKFQNFPNLKKSTISVIVPRRKNIKIRVGNSPADSRGSILIGLDAPSNSIISESAKAANLVDTIFETYEIVDIVVDVDTDYPF